MSQISQVSRLSYSDSERNAPAFDQAVKDEKNKIVTREERGCESVDPGGDPVPTPADDLKPKKRVVPCPDERPERGGCEREETKSPVQQKKIAPEKRPTTSPASQPVKIPSSEQPAKRPTDETNGNDTKFRDPDDERIENRIEEKTVQPSSPSTREEPRVVTTDPRDG